CMAAREGIGLVFFESVKRLLNLFDEWGNLQVCTLKMAECKAGPDCRDKQVADVGEIKAEQDAEQGFFEFPEPPLCNENNADRDRDGIITDVGELEQACEQRGDEPFHPHRGVKAEDCMIECYEEGVAGRCMNARHERAQTVKNNAPSKHRAGTRQVKALFC